jgi:hypothetical protein
MFCPFCGAFAENIAAHAILNKCYQVQAFPGVVFLEGKLHDGTMVQTYVLSDPDVTLPPPPVIHSDPTQWEHYRRYETHGLHCGNLDCEVCPYVAPDDAPPILNGPFPICLLPVPPRQARAATARKPYIVPELPTCPCCAHITQALGQLCYPCASGNHPIECPQAVRPPVPAGPVITE